MDVPWWIALIAFVVGALSGMTFTGSRWMKSYNILVRRYNNLYNGNPAEYGDGIHGWRCEHPDRYGRCDCFEEAVTAVMKLIGEER